MNTWCRRWGTSQRRVVVIAGCLHSMAYHKLHCVDVTGNDRWPPCFELLEHLRARAFAQRPLVGARQMDQPQIHRATCPGHRDGNALRYV